MSLFSQSLVKRDNTLTSIVKDSTSSQLCLNARIAHGVRNEDEYEVYSDFNSDNRESFRQTRGTVKVREAHSFFSVLEGLNSKAMSEVRAG